MIQNTENKEKKLTYELLSYKKLEKVQRKERKTQDLTSKLNNKAKV